MGGDLVDAKYLIMGAGMTAPAIQGIREIDPSGVVPERR
jgi:hypothetical protein